jgi:hypothetical protein
MAAQHTVRDQRAAFAGEVAALLDRLSPHKTFLAELRATGGQAMLIVQFLGDDGYFGDVLPLATLAKLTELQLDMGIEAFTVRQSP